MLRPWRLTVVLLVVSGVLGSIWWCGSRAEWAAITSPGRLGQAQLDAVLAHSPHDAQLQLGYALVTARRENLTPALTGHALSNMSAAGPAGPAFQRAIALGAGEPAQVLYALYLMKRSLPMRPASGQRLTAQWRPRPPTPQAQADLQKADVLLKDLIAHDRGNAMPHYLLAYVNLARGDDGATWQELDRGNHCQRSEIYALTAAAAAERLLRAAGRTPPNDLAEASGFEDTSAREAMSAADALAMVEMKIAQAANQRGQYARALRLIKAILTMSRIIRINATTKAELGITESITSLAITILLPESQAFPSNIGAYKGHPRLLAMRRAQAFADYAANHGATGLGRQAMAQVQDENPVMPIGHRANDERVWGGIRQALLLLPGQAGPLLISVVLGLLLLALSRSQGERLHAAPVPLSSWLVSLLVLILLPAAVAIWLGAIRPQIGAWQALVWRPAAFLSWLGMTTRWAARGAGPQLQDLMGEALALIATGAWLLTGLWATRVAQDKAAQDQPQPSLAATLTLSAVPLLASLCLLLALLLLALHADVAAQNHLALAMIRHGELHAFGISPK